MIRKCNVVSVAIASNCRIVRVLKKLQDAKELRDTEQKNEEDNADDNYCSA